MICHAATLYCSGGSSSYLGIGISYIPRIGRWCSESKNPRIIRARYAYYHSMSMVLAQVPSVSDTARAAGRSI